MPHRFFLAPELIQGEAVRFTPAQARQLATVLRLRPGERVTVLDGCGSALDVSLTVVTPKHAQGVVLSRGIAGGEPRVRLILVQGQLRAAKWETVLQKGTEVGVSRFVPLRCRRSVVSPSDDSGRAVRWRQIIQEAAEQSGRGLLPEVQAAVPFVEGCDVGAPVRILLHPGPDSIPLSLALPAPAPVASVALYVGPEGGFDDGEVEEARGRGLVVAHLGPRILRTETAGPVAAALALYALGEMEQRRTDYVDDA